MRIISWFAAHPVAANLLAVLILAGGLLTAGQIPQQIWPDLSPGLVAISVDYPGANPAAIEESICARIEDKILDLEEAKRVVSEAVEGRGLVTVELRQGADVAEAVEEIRSRVGTILAFPAEAEAPLIREVDVPEQLMTVALAGPADEWSLRKLAEQLRSELLDLHGVNQVEIEGIKPFELSLEIPELTLERYGLSFDHIAEAIRRSSSELAGGKVRGAERDVQLRTDDEALSSWDFADIPLITDENGARIRLGDLATISDGFAETDQRYRLDGQPVVLLSILRSGNQKASTLAATVKQFLEQKRVDLPAELDLIVWHDETRFLSVQLDILKRNGISGLILIILVLALFLRLRLAVWVALGIPISVLGAIWWMPALGLSFNFMSLFGFLIVIGIVVDDAVVVGENVYRHLEAQSSVEKAIAAGVGEVVVPVLVSTLTTIAAFSPLLIVPGNAGQVMGVIPRIVILTLTFSLVECLLILPHHLKDLDVDIEGNRERRGLGGLWRAVQDRFDSWLLLLIDRGYRPFLRVALEWRYLTIAVALGLLVITLALPASGRLRFLFFPDVADENIVALVSLPRGTSPELTASALDRLLSSAELLEQEFVKQGEPAFLHTLATVGQQPFRTRQQAYTTGIGSTVLAGHLGEVNIQLTPSSEREVSTETLLRRWRELAGAVPEAVELEFDASMTNNGPPIAIQLTGRDLETLEQAAKHVRQALEQQDSVFGVADSLSSSALEMQIVPNSEAEALGLSAREIGRQVRQAFFGEEVQRLQRGRHETLVTLRLTRAERGSLESLDHLWLRREDGSTLPFKTVASVTMASGAQAIRRVDGERSVDITADLDTSRRTAAEVITELESETLDLLDVAYPGVSFRYAGEQEEQREAASAMGKGFLFALFAIYALLALPFKSYSQPFVVLAGIPFGLAGAFWGHVLVGIDLTVFSIFGVVALSGVIVNDGLVLMSFVNEARRRGVASEAALMAAGVSRFRPIVLTSLTTFAGLTPLILEQSVPAQSVIPMAVSLGFGILFGTAIILILFPVGYRVLLDLSGEEPTPPSSLGGHDDGVDGGEAEMADSGSSSAGLKQGDQGRAHDLSSPAS